MKTSVSKSVELVYRVPDNEPITIYPRFCFDESVISTPNLPCFVPGISLEEVLNKKGDATICFWRSFALGDMLVLTPIFRDVKEKYPDSRIVFVTSEGYLPLFKYWESVSTMDRRMVSLRNYDVGYYMDGVVEKDHRGDRYSYMHRLDISCEFVGWPVPKDPIFCLPYSDKERVWAQSVIEGSREDGKPVAVMQLFGAMWFNRFSLSKVLSIAEGLSQVCTVIMVHSIKESVSPHGVTNLSGQTSIHELASLIDAADVAITMDSGVLWVAHCTKTPIIAMFGHTRAKEKMVHHRHFHSIDLAEMVGCESCFGLQTRCKGTVDCLKKSDTEKIIEQVKEGVKKLVYS